MERFEFSLKNKALRVWLITVIPIGLLSMSLYVFLPIELHFIPALLFLLLLLFIVGGLFLIRKKFRKAIIFSINLTGCTIGIRDSNHDTLVKVKGDFSGIVVCDIAIGSIDRNL